MYPFKLLTLLKVSALTISCLILPNTFAYEPIDKIVAVAGEEIILASELNRKLKQIKNVLKEKKQTNIDENILRDQVLDRLIIESLQIARAKRANISATQQDIDNTLSRTRTNLRKNGITFEEYIQAQGLTKDEVIEELRKEVIINKLQQGIVASRTNVTEKEIDNFLESEEGKRWLTPRLRLAHILLPSSDSDRKKTLSKANELYQALQAPNASFQQFAQKYSKGPNASKGGDLGLQEKDNLPDLFIQQTNNLNVNDITPPFNSPAGVHLLKVLNKQGASSVIVEQYDVRHILIKITDLFTKEEAKTKIDRIYEQLTNGIDFNTLAEKHTDDIGTKHKGGSLGWSSRGRFVPNFERTMLSTPIGEFSEPFASQFGWHILQVDGKREEDIFEQVKRSEVIKILRSQRSKDALDTWLKELRARANVEKFI